MIERMRAGCKTGKAKNLPLNAKRLNAIQLNRNDPWGSDAPGAWLVKITPDGTASKAD